MWFRSFRTSVSASTEERQWLPLGLNIFIRKSRSRPLMTSVVPSNWDPWDVWFAKDHTAPDSCYKKLVSLDFSFPIQVACIVNILTHCLLMVRLTSICPDSGEQWRDGLRRHLCSSLYLCAPLSVVMEWQISVKKTQMYAFCKGLIGCIANRMCRLLYWLREKILRLDNWFLALMN